MNLLEFSLETVVSMLDDGGCGSDPVTVRDSEGERVEIEVSQLEDYFHPHDRAAEIRLSYWSVRGGFKHGTLTGLLRDRMKKGFAICPKCNRVL